MVFNNEFILFKLFQHRVYYKIMHENEDNSSNISELHFPIVVKGNLFCSGLNLLACQFFPKWTKALMRKLLLVLLKKKPKTPNHPFHFRQCSRQISWTVVHSVYILKCITHSIFVFVFKIKSKLSSNETKTKTCDNILHSKNVIFRIIVIHTV